MTDETNIEIVLEPADALENAIDALERFPNFAPKMQRRLMEDLAVVGFNAARHIMVGEGIKVTGSMIKNNRMRIEDNGRGRVNAIIGNAARSAKGFPYPQVVEHGIKTAYTITPKTPGGTLSFYWAKLGKRMFLKSVTIPPREGKHVYKRAAEIALKEAPGIAARILRSEGLK